MDERLRFLVIAYGELVNSVLSDSEESRVLEYDYQQRCFAIAQHDKTHRYLSFRAIARNLNCIILNELQERCFDKLSMTRDNGSC